MSNESARKIQNVEGIIEHLESVGSETEESKKQLDRMQAAHDKELEFEQKKQVAAILNKLNSNGSAVSKEDSKDNNYYFNRILQHYKSQNIAPVRAIRYILGKGIKKEDLMAKSSKELSEIVSVLGSGLKTKSGFYGMQPNIKGVNGKIDKRNVKAFNMLVTDSKAMNDYLTRLAREASYEGNGRSR